MNNHFIGNMIVDMSDGGRVTFASAGLIALLPQVTSEGEPCWLHSVLKPWSYAVVMQMEPINGQVACSVELEDGAEGQLAFAVVTDSTDPQSGHTIKVFNLARIEGVMQGHTTGVMRWDAHTGRLVFLDKRARELFDYSGGIDQVENLLIRRVHTDDYLRISQIFSQDEAATWQVMFRIVDRRGSVRYIMADVEQQDRWRRCLLSDVTQAVSRGQNDLIETMPALYLAYVGSERRLALANARAGDALGIDQRALRPISLNAFMSDSDMLQLDAAERRCIETGKQALVEFRLELGQGKALWLQGSVQNPNAVSGQSFFIMIANVINDIKAAEMALAESHDLLQTITDNVDCSIVKLGVSEGRIALLFANENYYRALGYDEAAYGPMAADILRETVFHEDHQALLRGLEAAEGARGFEVRFVRRDGSVFWVTARARRMTDDRGEGYYLCTFQNIDHMKSVEQELMLSNSRYRLLLENTGDTYYELDLVNDVVYKTDGQGPKERRSRITQVPHSLFSDGTFPEEYREAIFQRYARLKAGSPREECVLQCRRVDGQLIWANLTLFGILDQKGQPVQALGMLEDITQQKEMEIRFAGEEQYRAAMISNSISVMTFSLTTETVQSYYWCAQAVDLSGQGLSLQAAVYLVAQSHVHPDDQAKVIEFYAARRIALSHARGGVLGEQLDFRMRTPSSMDEYIWVRSTLNVLTSPQSGELVCFSYIADIHEQKQRELELKRKAETDSLTGLFNRAAAKAQVNEFLAQPQTAGQLHAMIMLDLDGFKQVNDSYGHKAGDTVLKELADRLHYITRASDVVARLGGDEFIVFLKNADEESVVLQKAQLIRSLCCDLHTPGGGEGLLSASIGIAMAPRHGSDFDTLYNRADVAMYAAKNQGKSRVVLYSAVDGCEDMHGQPEPGVWDCEVDTLTGYSSWGRFCTEAECILKGCGGDEHYAVCQGNIRRFRYVNNAFGYVEGDRVLRAMADYVKAETREGEGFARVSGDSYVTLWRYKDRAELAARCQRVNDKLRLLHSADGQPMALECCVGIYCIESEAQLSLGDMRELAEIAEQNARQTPGGGVMFFHESMRERVLHQQEIRQTMYAALQNGEFEIYFQPQVDIQCGDRLAGVEALVRWNRGAGQLMMPADFLSVLESDGFILQVDEYVLDSVCRALRRQIDTGGRYVPVSVNVSAVALASPDFVERYAAVKALHSVPDELIQLEFSERLAMGNQSRFRDAILRLKAAGFLCAIDDFGSSSSSLGLLRDLPLDNLKLDRLFFRQSGEDHQRDAIVSAVVMVAQALDIKVITEGVEDMAQVEFLRGIGCEMVQGYAYAKPMPMADFLRQLDEHEVPGFLDCERVARL